MGEMLNEAMEQFRTDCGELAACNPLGNVEKDVFDACYYMLVAAYDNDKSLEGNKDLEQLARSISIAFEKETVKCSAIELHVIVGQIKILISENEYRKKCIKAIHDDIESSIEYLSNEEASPLITILLKSYASYLLNRTENETYAMINFLRNKVVNLEEASYKGFSYRYLYFLTGLLLPICEVAEAAGGAAEGIVAGI